MIENPAHPATSMDIAKTANHRAGPGVARRHDAMHVMLRRSTLHFHFCCGRIFYAMSRYDDADRAFRTVLRLNWRHEKAVVWIGKTSRASGRRRDIRAE